MKIKNTNVESVPFAKVVILDKVKGNQVAWFALYWSERAGIYGHQVCFEGAANGEGFEGKTSGCGYSKECQALQDCLAVVLGGYDKVYNGHREADNLMRKHHKGGNYYEMSMGQLRKVIRGA